MSDSNPSDNSDFGRVNVLHALAERIRASLKAAQEGRCHAWHHYLDIGDALVEAQERVSTGWKKWLHKNCCALSVRSAFRYTQLARHRAEIEAEVKATGGQLSLRAALRLITKPQISKKSKKPGGAKAETKAETTTKLDLNAYSDAEIRAALAAYTLERFLWVMPREWLPKLQRHAGGQVISVMKQHYGDKRLGDLKARHLALAVDNTDPPTTVASTTDATAQSSPLR